MKNYTGIQKQLYAYKLIFNVENSLRVAMHNLMVEKVGVSYFNESFFPEYEYQQVSSEKKINVVMLAKQLKGKEKIYNISLGFDFPLFWYLELTILISMIDFFWEKYFHRLFNTQKISFKKSIISRLINILPIRNAIAHHRFISNIDLTDLQSLSKILEHSLDQKYLENFNDIAMNSFETLVGEFISKSSEIFNIISKGKYIETSKIDNFKSALSAIITTKEDNKVTLTQAEKIIALLKRYNRLPRKPGSAIEIIKFKDKTKIEEELSLLTSAVGEYQ